MGSMATNTLHRALVLLIAFLALTLASLMSARALGEPTPHRPAIGVVPDLTWGVSRSDMDRTVALLVDAGVSWVRMNVAWNLAEPEAKGVLDEGYLSDVDYAVAAVRAVGIDVLMPVADGVPYWASADPAKGLGSWIINWRPANMSDFADFVGRVVARYGPMGVRHFEVWNEPNSPHFWPSGVDAAEYTALLQATHPAIKAVDPGATVVLGGLSKSDYGYLEELYAAGAGSFFDVANVHPYTGVVDPTLCWDQAGTSRRALDAFCGIEEVRAVMEANGDAEKPLWLTELGWSSSASPFGVNEAQQAEFLTKALVKVEDYSYVEAVFVYNFRNTYWLHDDPSEWEANAGLIRTDFSPKPAYAALRAYVGLGPTAALPDDRRGGAPQG